MSPEDHYGEADSHLAAAVHLFGQYEAATAAAVTSTWANERTQAEHAEREAMRSKADRHVVMAQVHATLATARVDPRHLSDDDLADLRDAVEAEIGRRPGFGEGR